MRALLDQLTFWQEQTDLFLSLNQQQREGDGLTQASLRNIR